MKDFDTERAIREQRDRRFKIAGREFTFRAAVSPDAFAEYVDLVSGQIDPPQREAADVAILDRTMLAFLTPDCHDAWTEARHDDGIDNPITTGDIHALISWMSEVQAGRPTAPSLLSGSGDGSSGTTSTGVTSPAVEAAATG